VLGQGDKSWRLNGSGGGYLPGITMVDRFERDCVRELSTVLEPILNEHGLQRLSRGQLSTELPPGTKIETNLGSEPYTQFDALFNWED